MVISLFCMTPVNDNNRDRVINEQFIKWWLAYFVWHQSVWIHVIKYTPLIGYVLYAGALAYCHTMLELRHLIPSCSCVLQIVWCICKAGILAYFPDSEMLQFDR